MSKLSNESLYKELKMNNQSKYLSKTLATITLSITLLMSISFVQAKVTDTVQPTQNQVVTQQVVNLNKSTLEQLVTLKGVGKIKAQAIIVYRQKVGHFKSINELAKVSGIGKKVVNENKARLTI